MPEEKRDIAEIVREGVLIDKALVRGAWQALEDHKRAGQPLVVWRDGRIQWISPEEFEQELARKVGA